MNHQKWCTIKTSAPGKVILFGEHAVVYKHLAIAACMNLRTEVLIKPTMLGTVMIDLSMYESCFTFSVCNLNTSFRKTADTLNELVKLQSSNPHIQASLTVLLQLLRALFVQVPSIHIIVSSTIKASGLGSSAAYAVALSAGLILCRNGGVQNDNFLHEVDQLALECEKVFHGKPSGLDNTTVINGGIISFQDGHIVNHIRDLHLPLLLIDSGKPKNTKKMVRLVHQRMNDFPVLINMLMEAIGEVSRLAMQEILMIQSELATKSISRLQVNAYFSDKSLIKKYQQMLVDINQGLLCSLGVSDPALDHICKLAQENGISAKLTGGGGGGCCYILMPLACHSSQLEQFKDKLASEGYSYMDISLGGPGVVVEITPVSNE